jgi:hypothetical protein
MKKIIFTVAMILFLGISGVNAQKEYSKTVIIRMTEARTSKPFMTIIDSDGKSSTVDLEKGMDESGANMIVLQREIEKWKREGFTITQLSTSGAPELPGSRTIVILEK